MIHIIIIILHFVFDWILQPRHIARRKGNSKDGRLAVMEHMAINIAPFSLVFGLVLLAYGYEPFTTIGIVVVNFISHWIIDIFLPKGKNERQMINWTALDQILHLSILFALLYINAH